MTIEHKRKTPWIFASGGCIGGIVFCLVYGLAVLDPANTDWLLAGGDLSQHYLGWCFFRNSAWHFPFGLMDNLVYPQLVSVVYTDSIPILAVFFKLLSPLLPGNFQYFGLWGLACYILTSALGAVLVYRFCNDAFLSLCGSVFFACSPYLLMRIFGHEALGAHWLLLAGILLIVDCDAFRKRWHRWLAWGSLFFIASGIHLYFLPMLGILLLMDCSQRVEKERSWQCVGRELFLMVCCCAVSLLHLLALGAFSAFHAGHYLTEGLGGFSSDLNTFVNAMGRSRSFPGLSFGGQWEGFGYLGLGMLVLVPCAAVLWTLHSRRVMWPLLGAWLLHFLLAVGPAVALDGTVLFTVPLPGPVLELLSVFRSTGRFIWPACYLLFLFAFAGIDHLPRRVAWVAVSACLALQVCDLSLLQERHKDLQRKTSTPYVFAEGWQEFAQPEYKHFVLLSPSYSNSMGSTYRVAEFARRRGMTLSNFYLARTNYEMIDAELQQYREELAAGMPRPDTVYVIDQTYEDPQAVWGDVLDLRELDGIWLGTAKDP